MRTNNKEIILSQHIKRYNSIRKKESRYLFALLILGIFFFFFANDDRKLTNENTVLINENNTSFNYNSYSLKTTNKELLGIKDRKCKKETNNVSFIPNKIAGENYDITFINNFNTNNKKIKLKIPIIDIEIEEKHILISSPFILCIFLLGILGSIRASDRASHQIKILCREIGESYDESPHLVNLSMDWSKPSTLIPEWLRSTGWVSTLRFITIVFLPLWLSIFILEVIYLIFIYKTKEPGFSITDIFLVILLAPLVFSVLYRLFEYWKIAIKKAMSESQKLHKRKAL